MLINMSLIHRSLTWAFYLVAGATIAAGIIASLVGLGWVFGGALVICGNRSAFFIPQSIISSCTGIQ